MNPGSCTVEVLRGGAVESIHRVHVAVAEAGHGLTASAGNPAHQSFVRSAIKMFQVLPFVESGGVEQFGFTGEELALCTASHGGEPFHVAAAASMLGKIRVTEDARACGAQPQHATPLAVIGVSCVVRARRVSGRRFPARSDDARFCTVGHR